MLPPPPQPVRPATGRTFRERAGRRGRRSGGAGGGHGGGGVVAAARPVRHPAGGVRRPIHADRAVNRRRSRRGSPRRRAPAGGPRWGVPSRAAHQSLRVLLAPGAVAVAGPQRRGQLGGRRRSGRRGPWRGTASPRSPNPPARPGSGRSPGPAGVLCGGRRGSAGPSPPRTGTGLVSRKNSVAPALYRSLRAVGPVPPIASGAANSGLPHRRPGPGEREVFDIAGAGRRPPVAAIGSRSGPPIFLTSPKSSSFATSRTPPRSVAKTLAGFTSRWISPRPWASARAPADRGHQVDGPAGGPAGRRAAPTRAA